MLNRRISLQHWWTLAMVLGVTLAAASPTQAQEESKLPDRTPVVLRHFPLLTPHETAGSGIAPEVQVEVDIDERGRVTNVKVGSIKPSSEHDEVFRQSTIETLLLWRYAPAIEDGKAIATTLKWTVQYRPTEEENPGPRLVQDPFSMQTPDQRRAELQTRSDAERQKLLERYAKSCEKHLDPLQRRYFASPRFVVVTDSAERETAEVVAANLEATYNLLDELFQSDIPPLPERYKIVVYIFRQRAAFARAAAELQLPGRAMGVYDAPGLLLFHLEAASPENLLHTLIHESFHAYSDSHLLRPGLRIPQFLEEGLAEYISNSQIKKGKLIPGKTVKSHFVIRHNRPGALRRVTRAGYSIDELKKAARKQNSLSVEDLFRSDLGVFLNTKADLFFPTSWLFVHFLRHGEEDWATSQFPAFLLYLVEGYPPREVLEAVYGVSPTEIDRRFRAYVSKL